MKGRVDLVIGGGLCLGLRSLEVSHLDLNLLKEEFLTEFSRRVGFCPGCMPTSRVLYYLLFGISLDDKKR